MSTNRARRCRGCEVSAQLGSSRFEDEAGVRVPQGTGVPKYALLFEMRDSLLRKSAQACLSRSSVTIPVEAESLKSAFIHCTREDYPRDVRTCRATVPTRRHVPEYDGNDHTIEEKKRMMDIDFPEIHPKFRSSLRRVGIGARK